MVTKYFVLGAIALYLIWVYYYLRGKGSVATAAPAATGGVGRVRDDIDIIRKKKDFTVIIVSDIEGNGRMLAADLTLRLSDVMKGTYTIPAEVQEQLKAGAIAPRGMEIKEEELQGFFNVTNK